MATYDLLKISTRPPKDLDKRKAKKETEQYVARISELQNIMYAEGKWSLLIVLQGMDASGKDGTVKKVFSAVNPQGISVKSFKKPSSKEMAHDYLWRVHKETPERGKIKIFNRSHYEEVLITRVEGWVDDETAHKRFRHINEFERILFDNNTRVIKFYLHISEEEQEKRFAERLLLPHKQWKYGPEDLDKAKQWAKYRKAYEDVFEHCGPDNPWIILPSDVNWYKEYIVAKTICEMMESFDMKYPKLRIDLEDPAVKHLIDKYSEEIKEEKAKKKKKK